MTYAELVGKLIRFRDDLKAHRELYAQSLDRTIPKYPVRNGQALQRQQEELTRQFYILDPYLDHFSKGRVKVHRATGVSWDIFREAGGSNIAPIKGDSIESAILELGGIIGVVESYSPDDEVVLSKPQKTSASDKPATPTYRNITITGSTVNFGEGAEINITTVTVGDLLRSIQSEIETKVTDPKEKKSLLSKMRDLLKHPAFTAVLQSSLPDLLRRLPM